MLTAQTVSDALEAVSSFDPHVVVTDLDLGPVGTPSGADLLARVAEQRPWVGAIVLSIHRDVRLALGDDHGLPAGFAISSSPMFNPLKNSLMRSVTA